MYYYDVSPLILLMLLGVCTCDQLVEYSSQWAVHVPGGQDVANQVAMEHGFINLGEIIKDHYHFHHNHVRKRSSASSTYHSVRLNSDQRVVWSKQQRILSRKKRDFVQMKVPRSWSGAGTSSSRHDKYYLNDPKWPHMWYLNRGGGLDMNVLPAWREGINGKGVVVTILDDGLESDHPDLADNYDPNASYDVNNQDADPQPRYDMIDSNRHGTRCAGQVAAVANNSLCAVGVAFGAKVGGVRMLDGDVTDAVEARSLSLNPQYVDIYSASWGPDDDGKTVDGPGELATRAFIEGVTKGRSGRGSIFVWASGNGGRENDNCNCDGYTNSIWTLSISAATERGDVPWYSEACSSTLAATYSSGALNEKQVVTTDLHHSCTLGHTGTSASAPLAAGICALALQSNPNLTWRDMQHIVVRTSRPERLGGGTWHTNGVGRNVSLEFGYGLLDAAGMVRAAKNWRTVGVQRRCEVVAPRVERSIPAKGRTMASLRVKNCSVKYLEHVIARVSLSASRRGDLRIELISPSGTRTTLLAPRQHDSSKNGFNSWPFMSVHTWGENPQGLWSLEIHNEGKFMGRANLQSWSLLLYGTTIPAEKNGANQTQTKQDTVHQTKIKLKPTKNRGNKKKVIKTAPTSTVTPTTISSNEDSIARNMNALFNKYNKIQRIYPRPIQGSGREGNLTRWELVFYGTEGSPQEDEDTQLDLGAVSDVRHHEDNGLSEHVSSPGNTLRDNHKIRDDSTQNGKSREDQFTHDTEENTESAGCLTHTSGQPHHCLECVHSLYLYNGKCYETCPTRTYLSELINTPGDMVAVPKTEADDMMMRSNGVVMRNIESNVGYRDIMPALTPKICFACHFSCSMCTGPYNNECVQCDNNFNLFTETNGSYCYPIIDVGYMRSSLVLSYIIVLITLVILAALCYKLNSTRRDECVNSIKYVKVSTHDVKQYPVDDNDVESEIRDILNESSTSDDEVESLMLNV